MEQSEQGFEEDVAFVIALEEGVGFAWAELVWIPGKSTS